MSYFLEDAPQQPMAPRGPDQLLSTWMQGLGAGTRKAMLEHDANMIARRTTLHVQDDVAIQAGKLLGMDRVKSLIEEQNAKAIEMGMPSQVRDMPTSIDEIPTLMGPNFSKKLLEIAREDAAANPAKWQGIDLSQEGIDTETNTRLQAEHREQQDTLDMMPSGRGAAETIGGIAAFAADAKNWPFLVAGGGEGALLKVLGREAMWNAASEAINLPAEFDMAKKLNIAPPSILGNLGEAAIGGAAIGGALHGLGRALEYFKGRSVTPKIGPFNEDYSNIIVSAAEDAIARGDNPIHAADHAMQALPGEALPDAAAFRDINAALDEFGPQTTPRIPEADRQFRVPQSATAIRLGEPALSTPATDIQTAVHNATLYRNARERDPVAFDAVQESQKKIATYRKWLSEMSDTQSKEVADIHATLDAREQALLDRMNTIQTGGRRAIKEELAKIKTARQDAMTLANKVETPDMAKVRRALMDEDVRMREYGPRVAKALSDTKAKPEPWTPPQKAAPEIQWTVPARGPEPQARGRAPSPDNIPATEPVVRDTFSDPASAEARPILDTMTADIRDEITKGDDFLIDMGDGKGERMASTVLDDLDKGDAAAARFDLCGRGPA